jgi:hypothetical protein
VIMIVLILTVIMTVTITVLNHWCYITYTW